MQTALTAPITAADEIMRIYLAGCEGGAAYRAGLPRSANPYLRETQFLQNDAWDGEWVWERDNDVEF